MTTTIESELAKYRECIKRVDSDDGCFVRCEECEFNMPIDVFEAFRKLTALVRGGQHD